MIELLLASGSGNKILPPSMSYSNAQANLVTGSTSGIPTAIKRAGACFLDHNGDINIIGGTSGGSMTGEKALYKYIAGNNSLQRVTTFLDDSRYYVSACTVMVNSAMYVYAQSYDKFDGFIATNPATRLPTMPSSFGTGNFNHSLVSLEKDGVPYLFTVRRSASTTLSVYGASLPNYTTLGTRYVTIPAQAKQDVSVSAVYKGSIFTYTGAGVIFQIDPFTGASVTHQLSGNFGSFNLAISQNYAHVENGHMYIPGSNTSNLLIINLKTFACTLVSYGTSFLNESASIFKDGRLYTFFGNSSSWNIRNYPQV